jgi:hypothetical protein
MPEFVNTIGGNRKFGRRDPDDDPAPIPDLSADSGHIPADPSSVKFDRAITAKNAWSGVAVV